MCGASGGYCKNIYVGGLGGCITSSFVVSSGETLTINVGGIGGDAVSNVQANGGYNGGGLYTYMAIWLYTWLYGYMSNNYF